MKNFILIVFSAAILLSNKCNAQTCWDTVGIADFVSLPVTYRPSIAIDPLGTPYVTFSEGDSQKTTVFKYNDTAWVHIGAFSVSPGPAGNTTIAIDTNGIPYISFEDGDSGGRVTVMKFNGTDWVILGDEGFSAGPASEPSIALDISGKPYVVYIDVDDSNKATVMKYNDTNWVNVGSRGFSGAVNDYPKIAIGTNDTIYVAYPDRSNNNKATVMKYNGTSWVSVGVPGFSDSSTDFVSIAIDRNGTPYVVYLDSANSMKATVKQYNGTTWITTGSEGFSPGQAFYSTIAIDTNGTPYIAYSDLGGTIVVDTGKFTVMKYNSGRWTNICPEGPTFASEPALALNRGGTPYVVFADGNLGGFPTVMKYAAPERVNNIVRSATSFSMFPNPNNGVFYLDISCDKIEMARVVIMNIMGEKVNDFAAPVNQIVALKLDDPSGMYFIKVSTPEGQMVNKFLISQ